MSRSDVRERVETREGGCDGVDPRIISQINSAVVLGAQELAREGAIRALLTDGRTMRAGDLCPEQGADAAQGFRDLFRG